MSTDFKALLEEFTQWQEERAVTPPDITPAAFLKERRDKQNEVKIQNALSGLDYMIGIVDRAAEFDTPGLVDLEEFITELRATLRGDDPNEIGATEGNTE